MPNLGNLQSTNMEKQNMFVGGYNEYDIWICGNSYLGSDKTYAATPHSLSLLADLPIIIQMEIRKLTAPYFTNGNLNNLYLATVKIRNGVDQ